MAEIINLDELILYPEEEKNIKRGDLIDSTNGQREYRNNGLYIFDGHNILPLDFDNLTDYGHIPFEEFPVIEEFPLNYWQSHLDYCEDEVLISEKIFRLFLEKRIEVKTPIDIDFDGDSYKIKHNYGMIEYEGKKYMAINIPDTNSKIGYIRKHNVLSF